MINIDITTKNAVYNTLGAQAQWIQHRFGRRDYPDISLDANTIVSKILNINDTFNFLSVYGDPCSHPNFCFILENIPTGKSVLHTYLNFQDDNIISLLNEKQTYVVVPLYGIKELNNKLILNSEWDIVYSNLKKLNTSVCVEFYVFEHNLHQVNEIKEISSKLGFDLKILKGAGLHPAGFSPIVDDKGLWLYDAYPCNEDASKIKWPELNKTVRGYNSLIQFIKPIKGKSILNNPPIYKVDKEYSYDSTLSISVTGHVFKSFELHRMFSNALCTDWNLLFSKIVDYDKTTIREDFRYCCATLDKVINILKLDNNLYEHGIEEVLSNFTNSNI